MHHFVLTCHRSDGKIILEVKRLLNHYKAMG